MRDMQTQTFSLPPEIPYTSTGVCRGRISHLTIGGVSSRCIHGRRHVFADPSVLSTFMDTSANVCIYAQQCADTYMSVNAFPNASVCIHRRPCLHISAVLSAPFSITLPCECREGRGEELAVTPVPRTSSGPIWQLKLDVCIIVKQQLQNPATEQVLLADPHAELWSHLSLLGNWQADQFMCIIHTPTLREAIMMKIVHIIIEFLRYLKCVGI